MKLVVLLALLILTPPAWATSYFISPSGSDGNNGLSSGAPWLSPNHALNCGDTISAASGTYSAANFYTGKWGTVTCAGNNNVAWLKCATFDTCKISSTTQQGMWIDKSYWGVTGWEVTISTYSFGTCFNITPVGGSTIHHIIFANNVANGCMGGGFGASNQNTTAGTDYIVYIGNIAYNTTQGTGECYSGFNVYNPIASDSNAGTHIYVAGNYAWHNIDGNNCGGNTGTTDGEGFNADTWDGSQVGSAVYVQQGVFQNNIEALDGGRGFEVENNAAGSTHAAIFFKFNTAYGSCRDTHIEFPAGLAQIALFNAKNVTVTNNLVYSGFQFCATGTTNAWYALGQSNGDASSVVDFNYASGVSGNNTFLQSSGSFAFGSSNIIGTNPSFASAPTTDPGAPSCGSFANVAACAASIIADFVPSASGASAYGYQTVSNTSINDSLFPQWLCTSTGTMNANIPASLVTPGCGVTTGTTTSGMHCQSGTSGGLPGPGGSPPTQGQPCG